MTSKLTDGKKFAYIHEDIIPIIMNWSLSTPEAIEFRSKVGFEQHDIVLFKEKSVISKIKNYFHRKKYCYNIVF